jgi:hypothetical protein
MTYLTGIVTVIHNASQVDFDNFVYSGVYCNSLAGNPYTINGAGVTMTVGETLEVLVDGDTTIPDTTNILFVGNPMPVQTEYPTGLISGGTTPTGWVEEDWQFVNIKNGNPTDG